MFDNFNRKYTFRAFKWAQFGKNWLCRSGDIIFDRQFSFINAISSSFYRVLELELFNLNFNSCAFKFPEKIISGLSNEHGLTKIEQMVQEI